MLLWVVQNNLFNEDCRIIRTMGPKGIDWIVDVWVAGRG